MLAHLPTHKVIKTLTTIIRCCSGLSSLLALVQDFYNLVRRELLAATWGDDGRVGNSADGVIVENDTHFGESGGQTYLTDEVGKEVNALVGILSQPYFLRPTTEFFFCALVDMSIEDWV